MHARSRLASFLLLTLLPGAARGQAPAETFFELKVRPILAGTCLRCHGGEKVSGGLRVDSRAALLRGGDSGPALVPGSPEKSLLLQALRHAPDSELKMPPGKQLPEHIRADFETWVRQGAAWPSATALTFTGTKHWAFQPVRKPVPPPDPEGWSSNPVDRFLQARWRAHGLRPVPAAEPRVLIRRLHFDLIGLPPRPEEVEEFVREASARPQAAIERAVDGLLASPHYGERWGRHWLDVARYADTAGDNADYPIPEARLYRDYVIASFNADKPYDRFVREQLAGDILARQGPPEQSAEPIVATGFLALSRRYATAPYELWHLTLEDTIDTVGQAFLGLTLRCARCHDHKFDPVTTADYYALYGIFASTQFPYAGSEELVSQKFPRRHFVPLAPPAEAATALKSYQEKIGQLQADVTRCEKGEHALARRVAELNEQIKKAQSPELIKTRDEVNRQLQGELNRLRGELQALQRPGLPPGLPAAYAVSEGKPADAPIQKRGDPEAKGAVVKRGPPRFLCAEPPDIPEGQSGRLQLAQWLTRPENPLTARVLVNRLWQHHFGRGLVGTPNNFGVRGEAPTHPELLDYLAATFVEQGWSIKALHRLLVTSKSYQLASGHDDRDPDNRWYARFERRRLDAEAIRDAILAVSGNLDQQRPGAHPFPAFASWGWTQHNPFKDVYPSRHRSVYLMTQRLQRHPFLALFDGPDTNTSTEKRGSSTVPQQALFLMNSPWLRGEAEAFARDLLTAARDAPGRIRRAHKLAYGRPPRPEEMERGLAYLDEYRAALRQAGTRPEQVEPEAWLSYARVLLCANEFVFLD